MDPNQQTIDTSIAPSDPNVTAEEAPRLSRQSAAVLARLQQGPATNDELAAISRKYTSRVSDLRAAGHVVECYERSHATGVTRYRLIP